MVLPSQGMSVGDRWHLQRMRSIASTDDALVRISAILFVIALVVGGARWYRAEQDLDDMAFAAAQERIPEVAQAAAEQRAVQAREARAEEDRAHFAMAATRPTVYRCRYPSGIVTVQNWPCRADASVEWVGSSTARGARDGVQAIGK